MSDTGEEMHATDTGISATRGSLSIRLRHARCALALIAMAAFMLVGPEAIHAAERGDEAVAATTYPQDLPVLSADVVEISPELRMVGPTTLAQTDAEASAADPSAESSLGEIPRHIPTGTYTPPLDRLPVAGEQETAIVPMGKSRVIKLPLAVGRVSVANPAIADILLLRRNEIYVVGKALGTTNLVIWDTKKSVQRIIGLEVTHDLTTLKEKMHQFLPGENIRIESSRGTIVLSGEVASPQKMDAALNIANSFLVTSNKDEMAAQVLNLMQLGGAQQVLLEVKVAEIARTLVKRLNIDFNNFIAGSEIKFGAVNGGAAFPDAILATPDMGNVRAPHFFDNGAWGPAVPEIGFTEQNITDSGFFMQYLSGDYLFELVIDAARNQGLAKILAEPNLTTLSGQQAKFISGGEFPIPVPSGNFGRVTVDFKEFGVGLVFVPVVLDSGVINLKVNVTVSDLDEDNAITLDFTSGSSLGGDFFVPALTKRAANATVEVPSGQTIAIAGLINESLRESVDKFPWLGDLPVLGPLFRSQEFVKQETELVIFVTPRLATPFDPELIKLPTDDFVEPNDTEFYLMGRMEGADGRRSPLGPDKSGTEGKYGHEL